MTAEVPLEGKNARSCTVLRRKGKVKVLLSTHLAEFSTIVGTSDRLTRGFDVHLDLSGDLGALDDRDSRREDIAGNHSGRLQLDPFSGVNCASDLSGDDRFLGVQITFDYGTLSHQNLRPYPYRPTYPALYSDHPFCLEVTDYCHVAGNNREGYLVGASPL
jgi:hypothetical protein